LRPYILFEKRINILALEMASPGNQHCASCIGTLSFPVLFEVLSLMHFTQSRRQDFVTGGK